MNKATIVMIGAAALALAEDAGDPLSAEARCDLAAGMLRAMYERICLS